MASAKLRFGILLTIALVACASCKRSSPLQSPSSAAITFVKAMAANDANAARQTIVRDNEADQVLDALAAAKTAVERVNDQSKARWGKALVSERIVRVHWNPSETLTTTMRDPNTAVVSAASWQAHDIVVRRRGAEWRVDLMASSHREGDAEISESTTRNLFALALALETTADAIQAGRLKTYDDAVRDCAAEVRLGVLQAKQSTQGLLAPTTHEAPTTNGTGPALTKPTTAPSIAWPDLHL